MAIVDRRRLALIQQSRPFPYVLYDLGELIEGDVFESRLTTSSREKGYYLQPETLLPSLVIIYLAETTTVMFRAANASLPDMNQ